VNSGKATIVQRPEDADAELTGTGGQRSQRYYRSSTVWGTYGICCDQNLP
jgi:hypothetical protein